MSAHIIVTGPDGKQTTVEVTGKQLMDEWYEKQARLKPYFDNLERMRDECTHLYPTYLSNAGIELCCGCCRVPTLRLEIPGQLEFEFPTENGTA